MLYFLLFVESVKQVTQLAIDLRPHLLSIRIVSKIQLKSYAYAHHISSSLNITFLNMRTMCGEITLYASLTILRYIRKLFLIRLGAYRKKMWPAESVANISLSERQVHLQTLILNPNFFRPAYRLGFPNSAGEARYAYWESQAKGHSSLSYFPLTTCTWYKLSQMQFDLSS